MGKAEKEVMAFIDSIPESKLQGFPRKPGAKIYDNADYRLDMQQVSRITLLLSSVWTY